ncbi:OmpW/AlkL family protein, partial [Burkholderia contaminans]|uniref:OmpW/AlkL family protein n=1 Tax=Burkholderia contaminans TaxID=488447 RepID=UPI0021F3C8D3
QASCGGSPWFPVREVGPGNPILSDSTGEPPPSTFNYAWDIANERASDTLGALNVGVNNAIVPELDFTYMIRDYLGVELILGTSRHQLTSSIGNLGGVGVLPPTLLLQYHFNHAGKVRPYVGAGVNYTYFYNNGLNVGGEGVSINKSSFGPALQFGVDVQLTKKVFMNVDVKKIWMSTDATLGDKGIGTLHIDPLIVGVGVGMKF